MLQHAHIIQYVARVRAEPIKGKAAPDRFLIILEYLMKKLLSCFILIFPVLLHAQSNNGWGAFIKAVNASGFAGKKFRLEAAVKVQLIDPNAEAEVWVRVDKLNKKMGFFYNMKDKPIRSNNWAVYTIQGKVDKDANELVFGG